MSPESEVPSASTEAMRAFWDARAKENAMWYIQSKLDFQNPDPQAFWASGEDALQRTLEMVDASFRRGDRVLEIGCGMGRMTRAIAARVEEVVGVDISPEMIARGQEALADINNVSLVLGNGHNLEGQPDATFDACYSFVVFQHVPSAAVVCDYIVEIGRVLKPGGWALFQVSELPPEAHRPENFPEQTKLRRRAAGRIGRQPRGCLEPQWLGSSLTRGQLLAALGRGGLALDRSVGDDTQFCMVLARKKTG
ncbi:MAG: methyltransferase domain-containing protein [Candidatus Dormibacteraeota bacterium]|nr:methyltransferase domain-containing protein [Candidatus Dormibacteraeota bacterium]